MPGHRPVVSDVHFLVLPNDQLRRRCGPCDQITAPRSHSRPAQARLQHAPDDARVSDRAGCEPALRVGASRISSLRMLAVISLGRNAETRGRSPTAVRGKSSRPGCSCRRTGDFLSQTRWTRGLQIASSTVSLISSRSEGSSAVAMRTTSTLRSPARPSAMAIGPTPSAPTTRPASRARCGPGSRDSDALCPAIRASLAKSLSAKGPGIGERAGFPRRPPPTECLPVAWSYPSM